VSRRKLKSHFLNCFCSFFSFFSFCSFCLLVPSLAGSNPLPIKTLRCRIEAFISEQIGTRSQKKSQRRWHFILSGKGLLTCNYESGFEAERGISLSISGSFHGSEIIRDGNRQRRELNFGIETPSFVISGEINKLQGKYQRHSLFHSRRANDTLLFLGVRNDVVFEISIPARNASPSKMEFKDLELRFDDRLAPADGEAPLKNPQPHLRSVSLLL
jgi:hypothetical protein